MINISCRKGCGACCIAPSLSSSIPGMHRGKPAGVRCAQLTADNLCLLFDSPLRPAVCGSYQASGDCGDTREEALRVLHDLEAMTGVAEHDNTYGAEARVVPL